MNRQQTLSRPAATPAFHPALHGKIALITGAGQGLGAAICRKLAGAGAQVVLADIKQYELETTTREIHDGGCSAHSRLMDVSNEHDVQEAVEETVRNYGGIDVVVNNAGVDYTKPIEDMSHAEWDRVMNVNLRGPFVVSKAVLPHMKKNGSGHIVNIVSTAAKRTWANAAAYHASKWGLLGFSHALHVEARAMNIKVTAVVAGGMRTPFIMDRFPDTDPGVLQDPDNVADTIRYVLSQPPETVIPEVMVIPMRETSWP